MRVLTYDSIVYLLLQKYNNLFNRDVFEYVQFGPTKWRAFDDDNDGLLQCSPAAAKDMRDNSLYFSILFLVFFMY